MSDKGPFKNKAKPHIVAKSLNTPQALHIFE